MVDFDSITSLNVERMILATLFMGVVAVVIFLKRRLTEYKRKIEEEK